MTKEKAKQMAEVLNAYAEGKPIEVLLDGEWCEIPTDGWDFDIGKETYRIKKTPTSPTYRPFKNAKECLEEMKKHYPVLRIKQNGYECLYFISPTGNGICVYGLYKYFTYDDCFNRFTFADGQPFGIKEEEI